MLCASQHFGASLSQFGSKLLFKFTDFHEIFVFSLLQFGGLRLNTSLHTLKSRHAFYTTAFGLSSQSRKIARQFFVLSENKQSKHHGR